ncbi:hypothetical protein EIP91_012438 [Steccherinum ochraceum]|uniref:Thioesterase domain-containing protein n=1 Tax=Steccherinum ochraceum TaxID=92696 RepID=A0A4R0RKG9_9APHY|nr:hypothetical protein EIP91_012438 [Steccherinum ochraceum]
MSVRLSPTVRQRVSRPDSCFHSDSSPAFGEPVDWLKPNLEVSPHHNPAVAAEAVEKLLDLGFDPESFWEQEITWGDHDSFQHVNNVRYVRFFESGRIKWMASLGHELGGAAKANAMLTGQGVSLILKSISMNYRSPVVYPDTLLIAHKPQPPSSEPHGVKRHAGGGNTHLSVNAVAYSYKQQRIVTESESVVVWYDYDRLVKCDPGEAMKRVIRRRLLLGADPMLNRLPLEVRRV